LTVDHIRVAGRPADSRSGNVGFHTEKSVRDCVGIT